MATMPKLIFLLIALVGCGNNSRAPTNVNDIEAGTPSPQKPVVPDPKPAPSERSDQSIETTTHKVELKPEPTVAAPPVKPEPKLIPAVFVPKPTPSAPGETDSPKVEPKPAPTPPLAVEPTVKPELKPAPVEPTPLPTDPRPMPTEPQGQPQPPKPTDRLAVKPLSPPAGYLEILHVSPETMWNPRRIADEKFKLRLAGTFTRKLVGLTEGCAELDLAHIGVISYMPQPESYAAAAEVTNQGIGSSLRVAVTTKFLGHYASQLSTCLGGSPEGATRLKTELQHLYNLCFSAAAAALVGHPQLTRVDLVSLLPGSMTIPGLNVLASQRLEELVELSQEFSHAADNLAPTDQPKINMAVCTLAVNDVINGQVPRPLYLGDQQ